MARGRKPGKGTFAGGRPEGSPNKKGSKKYEVYFRCGDELFQALSLAALEDANGVDPSVNLYVREFLHRTHADYIQQVKEPHKDEDTMKKYRYLLEGEKILPGDECFGWNADCSDRTWIVLSEGEIGCGEVVDQNTVPIRRQEEEPR